MRKRMLALLLAFAMLLGMMPATALPAHAEETVTPPFVSITTADGEEVSYEFKGMVPLESYADGPYYHVAIPEGTEKVLVTYPDDVEILGDPSAYSYTLSIPGYELGYGTENFDVQTNDDGSKTVTIPVENYLLNDGAGTAMSLEKKDGFAPITFFSFSYAQEAPDPEPSESEEPHSCSFDQKVTTEDYLAIAANCTDAATYYYSCECGKAGTETFTEGYKKGHSYEDNICTVCKMVRLWSGNYKPSTQSYLNEIEMTGAEAVSSEYTVDTDNKKVYMNVKVAEDTASDQDLTFTIYVKGRNGFYVYYKDADQTSYSNDNGVLKLSEYNKSEQYVRSGEITKSLKDGKLEFSLKTTVSNTTWYWYITVTTAHECVYDQKVVSEDYKATEADCTNAATYYYSCSCGEKGTQTFADGEALGHSYENGVCTSCGAACLSVAADASTSGIIKAGELYTLSLDKVFADAEGHALTYAFETTVSNQHTKIQENTFVFSAQDVGEYEVKLTATCAQTTLTHTVTITVEKAEEGLAAQYSYDETDKSSVTVYVTLSNDGMPVQGDDGTVMANLEVTVPYFDLSLYGLESYYRYGTEDGKGPYTNKTLIRRPTGLHLYIYLLERYYLGLPEDQCCLGKTDILNITDPVDVFYMDDELAYTASVKGLDVSGLATSLFLFNFWGHDCNLMYFRNHCYPYMSAGWGATADYILLSDRDSWDVGLFTNWQFNTTGGYFACFDQDAYTANAGEALTVSTLYWGTTSASTKLQAKTGLNVKLYDSNWEHIQDLVYDENSNSLTFTVPEEAGDYYLLALDPNATDPVNAKGAPAAAKLTVGGSSGTVDISKFYDSYDFVSVKDDQGRYLVDIEGYTVSTNYHGDVTAHQITVEEGTQTVYVTFPAGKSFAQYSGKYSVEDACESGYGKNVTLTNNDDGSVTIAIPIEKYLDTGSGILLENGNYQMCYGFDFVTGTITKVELGDNVTVSRILLNTYEKTLVYNSDTENTFQIVASVLPAEATGWTIQWSSSDESVAKVDKDGLVTAVGSGETVITASIGEITASCTITSQRYNTAPVVNAQMANHTKVKTGETVTLADVSDFFTDEQGDSLTYTACLCTPASVATGYEYTYTDGEALTIGEDGTCSHTFEDTGVYALKITADDGLLKTSFYYQVTVVPNDSGIIRLNDGVTLDMYNVAVVGHSEERKENFQIPYKGTHDTTVHHIVLSKITIEGTPYRRMNIQVEEGYGWCQYASQSPDQTDFFQTRWDIGLFAADLEGTLSAHYLQFHTECQEHTDEDDDGVCDVCTLQLRENAATITAYAYYATKADGIVTGKDGTVLNYVPVTVTDADEDGIITMSDAFYALHEAYYEGGAAAGYENGFLIKFWGVSLSYGQFERNGNKGVYPSTGIEDGDMIAVTAGFGYNSLWAHFAGGMDGLKDTATAKKAKTFYITAYQANGAAGNVTLPVGATVTATCGDTTLTTTVDEKGAFTLTFPTAGEYSVLVDGTSEVNGVKCSVIPAGMTVTVEAAPYTVTLPEGEGYTVTGETTVVAGEDYRFTVTITDGKEYIVKVNGKTVVSDEDGVYTVETVSEDLVITVTEFSKIPQKDSAGTYLIENGYQLKWFADQVNGGEYKMDAKLVSDIDLSVVCGESVGSWTPIGHYKDNAYYQGTFDGQGYTISNFYMYETGSGTDGATYYRGLFGQVQAGTTIQNVNLTGSIYTTLRFVGGLVGKVGTLVSGDVTIDNCHVSVDIESDSSLGSVGGIAGQLRQGTVSNCSYSGTIKTGIHTSAGGILGNTSTMSGTVSGCLFTGSITSSGGYWEEYGVGGIVGCAGSGTYTITNCANLGSIKASLLNVGGIVGTQYKANVTITGCYNAGTSDASGVVGGILGQITTGGRKTTVEDCYYLDTFATTDAAGGSAKTAEAMKSNTMVILLGDGFKKSNGTVNGGYPGLSWQKYEAPALPESLDVTLTNGDGYTLSGDCLVAKGDSYTVTIDIELGYETDDSFAIQANGVAMTNNGDSSFTLSNAEEALTITVEGVVKSANAPVNITLTPGDGYTLTGETRVAYGSDYRFTLEIGSAYGKAETFAVKANGEPLTAGEDGSYTVSDLTENLVITVEGVLPAYTVKVNTSAAYTLSAYEGYAEPTRSGVKLLSNQDYKFIVTPNEGYGVRDNNYGVSSGTNVFYSYEVEDDHAVVTVSYQKGDGTISISGVKKIMQVTVPEDAGYTIIPGEDVADIILKGETYRFTLELTDGYRLGNGAAVKAGDTVLTANDEGVYSFQVNADTAITVTGVEKIPTVTYTVTLPTSGNAEGHAVSGYSNVVGIGGTFKFTVEPKVGYQPGENFAVKANGETLTATNGVYTLENITSDVTITVEGMEKIIWEPVNVYLSMSHDDKYLVGKESQEVMALRKISVPYFDLGLYGLENFYFQSESYGSDGGEHSSALEPGTAQYAYGKITLLHLYIYSLEVYYCGLDEAQAGKGYLYNEGLIGTDVLTITGSVGSLYMSQFWGGDENLNYYVNYQYPLASAGWGSTSDQILLRENDVITLGHFTSWSFFNDPSSVFNYLTPDEENQVYGSTTVTQGDPLTLTAYRAGAGEGGNYATGHTVLTTQPTIYYTGYDDVDADFENWTELGKAGADGTIEIDTTGWEPGTYVVAMAGQYGTELTDVICSTPGGILVVVEEEKDEDVTPGDINGDGKIEAKDVVALYSYLNGKSEFTENQLSASDVNGDGKVDAKDALKLYAYINNKIETLKK